MAGRLENLKALNTDRWKAHSQTHTDAPAAEDDGGASARDREQLLWTTPASTGGALFNLPNPTNDGEFVKPYIRDLDKQAPRYRGELTWIDPKTYERVPMPLAAARTGCARAPPCRPRVTTGPPCGSAACTSTASHPRA